MKDHFDQYRKAVTKKNVAIVASAFALAVSVNAALFGTEAGTRIQTSAVEFAGGPKTEATADLVPVSSGTGTDLFKLRLEREVRDATEVRATLLWNPESVQVRDVFSTDKDAEIVKISNEPGILLLNVRFKTPKTLPAGSDIATAAYAKTGSAPAVVTLSETAFVAKDGTFELSNSAAEF